MRPLRYSINVTLGGCCDHRAMFADEELFRHVVDWNAELVRGDLGKPLSASRGVG